MLVLVFVPEQVLFKLLVKHRVVGGKHSELLASQQAQNTVVNGFDVASSVALV